MSDQLPDRAWLSPLLGEIAEVAGERAALILGRDKACQRVRIPYILPGSHWLIDLVGDEAAQAIVVRFGGSRLDIPPALVGQKRRRRRVITEMTNNGMSTSQIARALGVARSTVAEHRRRLPKAASPQGDLFPDEEAVAPNSAPNNKA